MTLPNTRQRRALRARRRADGLCIECGMEAVPGETFCGYHAELAEERLKMLHERKKHGCTRCGKPPVPGYRTCQRHLDASRARHAQRKEAA